MVALETGCRRKSTEQLIHCCTNFNYNWLINAYRQFSALGICEESIPWKPPHGMEHGKTEWKKEVMHRENTDQEKIQC